MKPTLAVLVLATGLLAACGSTTTNNNPNNTPADASVAVVDPPKLITTAPGTPLDVPITKSIDSSGGTLATADNRISLTVPPNTVATPTTFSIQPITTDVPNSIGTAYRLEPHGTQFSKPITLTLTIPEAGVSRTTVDAIHLAFQNADGTWTWGASTSDTGAKTVSVTTTHFSDWSVLEKLQLKPMMATVPLNDTIELQVYNCAGSGAELPDLVYDCQGAASPQPTVKAWAVNGQPGGNATLGTIDAMDPTGSPMAYSATFHAPGARPTPEIVGVSATLSSSPGAPTTILFAHVAIGDPATYHGAFTLDVMGSTCDFKAKGDLTITPRKGENGRLDDDALMTSFDIVGTIAPDPNSFTMGPTITCISSIPSQDIKSTMTMRKSPLGQQWSFDATWPITCDTGDGNTFDTRASVHWLSGCMPSSSGTYVFLVSPEKLDGAYSRNQLSCPQAIGTTTVGWNFAQ